MKNIIWKRSEWHLNELIQGLQFDQPDDIISEMLKMREEEKLVVPRLEAVVTFKCTLKCKGCAHLIDLYKDTHHLPIDAVIANIDRLLEHVDKCISLTFTGGEPFLHPSLAKIVSKYSEHPKIYFIDITTNGTIIPPTEVLETFRKKNILIKVNEYPDSIKFNELITIFDKYGIKYNIIEKQMWHDFGDFKKRNKSSAKLIYDFMQCYNGIYCKILLNEKIFHCPRAAFLYNLGYTDLGINFIEINDDSINSKDIEKFYSQNLNTTCNYCDRMERKQISRGIQTEYMV